MEIPLRDLKAKLEKARDQNDVVELKTLLRVIQLGHFESNEKIELGPFLMDLVRRTRLDRACEEVVRTTYEHLGLPFTAPAW